MLSMSGRLASQAVSLVECKSSHLKASWHNRWSQARRTSTCQGRVNDVAFTNFLMRKNRANCKKHRLVRFMTTSTLQTFLEKKTEKRWSRTSLRPCRKWTRRENQVWRRRWAKWSSRSLSSGSNSSKMTLKKATPSTSSKCFHPKCQPKSVMPTPSQLFKTRARRCWTQQANHPTGTLLEKRDSTL